jgi:hypothetical protein
LNKLDGTAAINASYDDAIVQYQVRAAAAGDGVVTAESAAAAPAAAAPSS